jgi:hypothetical protein
VVGAIWKPKLPAQLLRTLEAHLSNSAPITAATMHQTFAGWNTGQETHLLVAFTICQETQEDCVDS